MSDATTVRRTRALGRTELTVGPLTLGTSGLGRRPGGAALRETLSRALADERVSAVDTANEYGEAEARVGAALARAGGLATLVLTKVDPLPGSDDFSGARVRASVAESRRRLGLDHLPLVHLHDPERIDLVTAMAPDGPVRALLDLREAGVIGHVGVAGGPVGLMEAYVRTGLFEAVVTHNRWTLLDRSAQALLDACAERGVGVFNAAPFGGGYLTGAARHGRTYAYRRAVPAVAAAADAMAAACTRHGIPLAAAALQFSTRDSRVHSTIVGASSPAHLEEALVHAERPVPDELWDELETLTPAAEHWLGAEGR